jgi:putative Ig domain-containing protein
VTTCNNSSSSNTISVTNPGSQTTNVSTTITPLQIVATDTDTSQVLTYSATGLPTGLSINTSTGAITGTFSSSPATVTTHVTATDSSGGSGTATFTWIVEVP